MKPAHLFLLCLVFASTSLVQAKEGIPPTPVIVSVTTAQEFADSVEALGTLKANESVELTTAVSEIVSAISFNDNQRVKKGDVLIEMDASEELAELEEQESFRQEAQRQVDRLIPLVKKGSASTAVLDQNRQELEGAKARINAIKARMNKLVVKAPFDGVLGLRNISVGALVQPGSIITTIDDDSVMKLDFSVPEIFLSTLKRGVVIAAQTEAYKDKTFSGEIAFVDSRVDPVSRSIKARALIDNTDSLLKPGLLMQVELLKNPRTALLVPEEALIADAADNFLLVVTKVQGKVSAERRKVQLGTRRFGEAEIVSGLDTGEQIVTHGTLRVRPGAPLEILGVETGSESLKQLIETKSVNQQVSE